MISKDELEDIRKSYVFGKNAILQFPRMLYEIERLTAELDEKDRLLLRVREFMGNYRNTTIRHMQTAANRQRTCLSCNKLECDETCERRTLCELLSTTV